MKNLVWLVDTSLDGFISSPDGGLDWAARDIDTEYWSDVNELLRTVDTTLFGRATYQNFEQYWPAVTANPAGHLKDEIEFSRWIEATPKFVASKTLSELPWKNSHLLKGNLNAAIAELKAQSRANVLIFGSSTLSAQLLEGNLIGLVHLRIHPVVLGAGRPLVPDLAPPLKLKLLDSKSFHSGVVRLRYQL